MKKIIYFIIGLPLLLNSACRLDKLDVDCLEHATFERKYTNAPSLNTRDIKETTDGRYIICGNVDYDSDTDIFLMKIDKQGEVIFFKSTRKVGTNETCNAIVITEDRGVLMCGDVEDRAYFAKFNFEGTLIDDTAVELFNNSECSCLVKSNNDINYLFSGHATNPDIGNSYVGLLSMEGQKPQVITHYLPNPRNGGENALSVIPSKDNFTVVGHSSNSFEINTGTGVHFYRLNSNLQMIPNSEKIYRLGTQIDFASEVLETSDGNYLICGKLNAVGEGANAFVIKVDPNGEILHQNEYGGNANDAVYSMIRAHEPGHYIIAGFSKSFNTDGSEDGYVAKIKEDGTLVWEKTFGEAGVDERTTTIVRTECEGYIVAGFANNNDGTKACYVVKMDANGNVE